MSAPDAAFIADLFGALGPVRVRRMFGGAGVYLGDAMFALVANDMIYLRTDDALAADLAAEGSAPFVYTGKHAPVTLPYWRLPETALDDPDIAAAWALRALVPAEAKAEDRRAAKARTAMRRARRKTGGHSA